MKVAGWSQSGRRYTAEIEHGVSPLRGKGILEGRLEALRLQRPRVTDDDLAFVRRAEVDVQPRCT